MEKLEVGAILYGTRGFFDSLTNSSNPGHTPEKCILEFVCVRLTESYTLHIKQTGAIVSTPAFI